MSEQTQVQQQVTTKDPKKVEVGKRLAEGIVGSEKSVHSSPKLRVSQR